MSEYDIIFLILGVIVPIVSSVGFWKRFKLKLNMIRKLIVAVDDAIYDDKVSEVEFRNIWTNFMTLVDSSKSKTPGE